MPRIHFALAGVLLLASSAFAESKPLVLQLWPGKPPGEDKPLGPEHDMTKPTDRQIAGKPVIRLTDVSTPTLTVYAAASGKHTGAAVIICPGGGHRVLAWDLEGTEVAEWFAERGVTAIVLKYRVPARDPNQRYRAAVQDAQRAVSFVRSKASDWKLDPNRIGLLGFSAGGETAGLTALFDQRLYEAADAIDKVSHRPNFAALIYPGGLADKGNDKLREHVKVTSGTPPFFFAHAGDDNVSAENSVLLYLALKQAKVPAELHVFAAGGHGFGLRPTEQPVTAWPERCEAWLKQMGMLKSR
jgi:acetyl esterase/lipase